MPENDAESEDRAAEEAEEVRQRGQTLLVALADRLPAAPARSAVAGRLAEALVEAIALPAAERMIVVEAARLQEVGKVYVPVSLLRRRLADLDRRALAEVEAHYEHGRALGLGAGLPPRLCSLILNARERWDGEGPNGLTGEEIPLGSRVVAVTREYIDAPLWLEREISADEALAVGMQGVREQAGASLDPELAELAAVLADPERAR